MNYQGNGIQDNQVEEDKKKFYFIPARSIFRRKAKFSFTQ